MQMYMMCLHLMCSSICFLYIQRGSRTVAPKENSPSPLPHPKTNSNPNPNPNPNGAGAIFFGGNCLNTIQRMDINIVPSNVQYTSTIELHDSK